MRKHQKEPNRYQKLRRARRMTRTESSTSQALKSAKNMFSAAWRWSLTLPTVLTALSLT